MSLMSARHADSNAKWHAAIRAAYGRNVFKEHAKHHEYSDVKPDVSRLHAVEMGRDKHVLYEQKIASVHSTGDAGGDTPLAGTLVGGGNSIDYWREVITGAPRTASSPAKRGAYSYALRRGHRVHALVHETYGGFGPGCVALLYQLSRVHGSSLGADHHSAPWCARSFRSLHAMKISVAIHMAAAGEIRDQVRDDTAADLGEE